MPRNLDRRVEILFPVQDARLVRHLRDQVLEIYLSDNVKARQMLPDGTYRRPAQVSGHPRTDSQAWLINRGAVTT